MIKELYDQHRLDVNSDIYQHLPILYGYALQCDHITEMGTRRGCSTSAFLNAAKENNAKVISYDLDKWQDIGHIESIARIEDINYTFIQGNVLLEDIEPTDFLFIDTYHTGGQLRQELAKHHSKVKKYLGFHDTTTFGEKGEDGNEGLMPAIEDFLKEHPEWKEAYKSYSNNGLLILGK